jgi:large subunit ribosomal protein L3
MISLWDTWGVKIPLTILHLDNCQVVQVKTPENGHSYTAMQLGVGEAKVKNVTKPERYHQLKAGVMPKRKLMEFRVTEDALLPTG